MPDQPDAMSLIREMARRLAAACHPEKIILFGSHACGQAGSDSDADLLVVTDFTGSRRDLVDRLYKAVEGTGLPKDIVVATPQEFQRFHGVVGTVIYPAVREGVVLYERAS